MIIMIIYDKLYLWPLGTLHFGPKWSLNFVTLRGLIFANHKFSKFFQRLTFAELGKIHDKIHKSSFKIVTQ